jgi:taurine dehydrogenase small subunit
MTTLRTTRAELEALLDCFMDAWARHDLDAAMACVAENSRYDEFNRKVWEGKAAVREGFLPQFRGDYGDIQFLEEDRFIDADAGRLLVRWVCQFEWKGTVRRWRGLDILHVRDGLITEKLTYAKTERPLTVVQRLEESLS